MNSYLTSQFVTFKHERSKFPDRLITRLLKSQPVLANAGVFPLCVNFAVAAIYIEKLVKIKTHTRALSSFPIARAVEMRARSSMLYNSRSMPDNHEEAKVPAWVGCSTVMLIKRLHDTKTLLKKIFIINNFSVDYWKIILL